MESQPIVRKATAIVGLGCAMAITAALLIVHGPDAIWAQGACPPVENTPFFTIVYGAVILDGSSAPTGTIVEAHSPRGDVVGCFMVQDVGDYGAMYVYGEDTTVSPTVPGMRAGEEIAFVVEGADAVADPVLGWSNDKDLHNVDLAATGATLDARFSASPTSGLAPLTVDFTNSSTGDYDTCTWEFGDGASSSECDNPSHQYASPGVYTVSLTVSGSEGSDTVTRMDYITVYEAVVADFSSSATSGVAPLTVGFTNLSTGDYDTCSWDFGDGEASTSCGDPSHEYASAGSYTVELTVSGPGGSDTMTRIDYITVHEAVAADFSGSPASGTAPLTVDFTNLSTGDYDACSWIFGDGETSTVCADLSHEYGVAGVYTVTLSVDGSGGADTEVKPAYVTVGSLEEYSLHVTTVGHGTVTKEPDEDVYPPGEEVTLTAGADPGWTFVGWSGDVEGIENPLLVEVEFDTFITATFRTRVYLPLALANY